MLLTQACLKEIHAKMLHKHLQRLEGRVDGEEKLDMPVDLQPEEESEPDANGMLTFICSKQNSFVLFYYLF